MHIDVETSTGRLRGTVAPNGTRVFKGVPLARAARRAAAVRAAAPG